MQAYRNSARSKTKRQQARRRNIRTVTGGGAVLRFTGSVMNDVLSAAMQGIAIITESIETIAQKSGAAAENLGTDVLQVRATQVFDGLGSSAHRVGKALGDVISTVPLVGGPTAYVVRSVDKGVHYIVVKAGELTGTITSRVGQTVRQVGDIVVFTVATVQSSIEDAQAHVSTFFDTLGDCCSDSGKASTRKASGGTTRRRRR